MWRTKIWKFKDEASMEIARAKMQAWLQQNQSRIQYDVIFVNNAYGVEYRPLRRIG